MKESMNHKAVYRTATATPGLLNIVMEIPFKATATEHLKFPYFCGTPIIIFPVALEIQCHVLRHFIYPFIGAKHLRIKPY